jgi:hypothetical protein
LIDELVHLRIVERGPGLFKLTHDPDRHDDQAVCVGMACVHLLEQRPSEPGFAVTFADVTLDEADAIDVERLPSEGWRIAWVDGGSRPFDDGDARFRGWGPYARGGGE